MYRGYQNCLSGVKPDSELIFRSQTAAADGKLTLFRQITGEYTVRAKREGFFHHCQLASLGFQSPQTLRVPLVRRDPQGKVGLIFALEYSERLEGTLSVQTKSCLVNQLNQRCPELQYFGSPLEERVRLGQVVQVSDLGTLITQNQDAEKKDVYLTAFVQRVALTQRQREIQEYIQAGLPVEEKDLRQNIDNLPFFRSQVVLKVYSPASPSHI